MLRYVLAFLLIVTPAIAQQQREYKFTLTEAETAEIWNALLERPWKQANPVIGKLKQQIDEQNKPAEPPKQ